MSSVKSDVLPDLNMSSMVFASSELKPLRKCFPNKRTVTVAEQQSLIQTTPTVVAEYVYEPLKKNHIQFLELLPEESLEVICFRISSIDLWQERLRRLAQAQEQW